MLTEKVCMTMAIRGKHIHMREVAFLANDMRQENIEGIVPRLLRWHGGQVGNMLLGGQGNMREHVQASRQHPGSSLDDCTQLPSVLGRGMAMAYPVVVCAPRGFGAMR